MALSKVAEIIPGKFLARYSASFPTERMFVSFSPYRSALMIGIKLYTRVSGSLQNRSSPYQLSDFAPQRF